METEKEQKSIPNDGRLGKCEVCNFNLAKYTCPKCEVKTCQIECLRVHKKELNCDGIRDKTKYIPLKQITESDLMSDYVFLESCTNYASARRTDKVKRFTSHNRALPITQMKLKRAAAEPGRQIKLNFLLPNFDKHKANKTYYDWASKVIYWCVEWRFINADNRIIMDERCCESHTMTELCGKYLDPTSSFTSLASYRSAGLDNIVLLLKAEGIRKSQNRFYPMDLSKTLQENLQGKTLIEYPVVYAVLKLNVQQYDVINDDEEGIIEETDKHKNHYFPSKNQNKPTNFLFSNEDDIDDDET